METGTERRDEQRWFLRASVSEAGGSEIAARIGKLGIAGKPWAALWTEPLVAPMSIHPRTMR
jgi:hypothetical protein